MADDSVILYTLMQRINELTERVARLERRGEIVEDWHGKCKGVET